MLYSNNNQYPKPLPFRIVLSDGRTRTDPSTFTAEELADAGYRSVNNPPLYDPQVSKLTWDEVASDWAVIDLSEEEIEHNIEKQWSRVRRIRDSRIQAIEWRVLRHLSEIRLGLTPTEPIEPIDQYIQELRNITTTNTDPYSVNWPNEP